MRCSGANRHMTVILWLGCLLVSQLVSADTLTGRVVGIADGDTLTVLDSQFQQHKIRLVGIDAPESEQPFGTRSQQHLGALVFGKTITVDYDEQDHYGRTLGKVLINGRDVNLKQVQAGLAWHYKAYQSDQAPADRAQYASAEISARKANLGLWSDPYAVPPWDWRRGIRDASASKPAAAASGCIVRRNCGELGSCGGVRRYVRRCGSSGLDGDGDGIACESLCR